MPDDLKKIDFPASKEIRRLVAEYCANQRHPHLKAFTVHGPFTQEDIWNFEGTREPGCYVIYGVEGSLRYIGMSLTSVGNRISRHLSPSTQNSRFWKDGEAPHYFDVIEVAEVWEAPSLELYLTTKTRDGR